MKLHELKPSKSTSKKGKRLGRGNGSGKGTFCGKGCKGGQARSGGAKRANFEGGQTPLLMKLPKLKGFKNPNHVKFQVFNLSALEENFKDGDTVNHITLVNSGLLKRHTLPVKILGSGKLTKKLTVVCEAISKSAEEAIKKAGGEIQITLVKKSEEKSE